ncbi:hypothetical protein [Streptomyces sp. CRN 30]|uniref:hypothetical protein n=1 Tax=Streptomyces sp. CRN 30 TaxID=3075613 RepID=UPI002A7FD53E|nr:hypothetical protein [Streptomyces sp. CRN 30]
MGVLGSRGNRAAAGAALRPEDRSVVEEAVRQALDDSDVRAVLTTDPTGRTGSRLLRQALDDAEEIAAAAGEEYRVYLTARTATRIARSAPRGGMPGVRSTLRDALAVVVPLVSAAAAALLLLTGYGLRLADTAAGPASTLVTAGWLLALVAAATACYGLQRLLRTVLNRRKGAPGGGGLTAERAREQWLRALMDKGVLPYLRHHLPAGHPGAPDATKTTTTTTRTKTAAERDDTRVGQSE